MLGDISNDCLQPSELYRIGFKLSEHQQESTESSVPNSYPACYG